MLPRPEYYINRLEKQIEEVFAHPKMFSLKSCGIIRVAAYHTASKGDCGVRIKSLLRLSEVENHRTICRGHLEVVWLARNGLVLTCTNIL
jgi:hypothetical protein